MGTGLIVLAVLLMHALAADLRLRTVVYSADEIYRLPARLGYEIDLEFAAGESFQGLGAGDIEGLAFKAQGNHLFIKPKATHVRTNLTVVTNRRVYHFDYVTVAEAAAVDAVDMLYALRFVYPADSSTRPTAGGSAPTPTPQELLAARSLEKQNSDYWYCGARELKPASAWDDGVQTHLQFNSRSELPAVFVWNADGSEQLVNFTVSQDAIILHRIARRFIVRRGRLAGCIVNRGYAGSSAALPLQTTSPRVERRTRATADESLP